MRNLPDDDTGLESFRELAARLDDLNRRAVRQYAPLVESLVQSGSRNAHLIEQTLDGLLGFCGSAACLELFRKLCRHYWTIDPAATTDYIHSYRDMWERPDDDKPPPPLRRANIHKKIKSPH